MATGLTFYNSFIPNEIIEKVFNYLQSPYEDYLGIQEDWVIIQATEVCKAWNENRILQSEREKAITHMQKYVHEILDSVPKEIVEIFHRCGVGLSNKSPLHEFQSLLPFQVPNKYQEDFLVEKPIMFCSYAGFDTRTGIFYDDSYLGKGCYTGIIITLWDKNRESKKGIYDSWKGRKNRIDYEDSKKMIEEYGEVKIACYKWIPNPPDPKKEKKFLYYVHGNFKEIVTTIDDLGRISIKYPNMPQILEQLLLNKHPHYEIPGHRAGNPRIKSSTSFKNSALISTVAIAALAFV